MKVLNTSSVDKLSTIVEEGARANEAGVRRFIEPGIGTLRRAISRRHHIIFGRRGSGKTSLLKKAAEDLRNEERPVAYVDLEAYKGNQYPDVLISVLMAALTSFEEWIASDTSKRPGIFQRILKPRRSNSQLSADIKKVIKSLRAELLAIDDAEVTRVALRELEEVSGGEAKSSVSIKGIAEASARAEERQRSQEREEIQEAFRRKKIDYLHRHIIDYQSIFKSLTNMNNGDAYIFLDDLYHIKRQDQAELLDYFHRVIKGNNVWLKIGTIRRRSQWYLHGDPPVGLKLGDDAEEIDLDLTLERYGSAKTFLVAILNGLIKEAGSPSLHELLAEGAVDRLVLASGGVARDFLGIFRRSIDETRERMNRDPNHYRGEKIGAEDVNLAVGSYGDLKREEFARDSLEDRVALEKAFDDVRNFCINISGANCFLLDQAADEETISAIEELMDLRLLHLVQSRVTVSKRPRSAFKAYMLDMSQYVGARARRDLDLVEFWKRGTEERLRKVSLIYK